MRTKWVAVWLAPFLCFVAGQQRREPAGEHADWLQGWLPGLAQRREARGVDSCQRDGAELVRDGHRANLLQEIGPRSRPVPSQDRRAMAGGLQGKHSGPSRDGQGERLRCLDGAAALSAPSQHRQARDDHVSGNQGERQLLSGSAGCQIRCFAGAAGTDEAVSRFSDRMRCGGARTSMPGTPGAGRAVTRPPGAELTFT
jgi:hypothetical protein